MKFPDSRMQGNDGHNLWLGDDQFFISGYLVLWVQLMQQPLVHHLVQPLVQLLVQLSVQYLVQLSVQLLVQPVQELHGSGLTVVLPVQLSTHEVVQPASHMPACAMFLPPSTEMATYDAVNSSAFPDLLRNSLLGMCSGDLTPSFVSFSFFILPSQKSAVYCIVNCHG